MSARSTIRHEPPTVTLTSYNMGDATEADYGAWAAYVCEHIDERAGFSVAVEVERYGAGPWRDVFSGCTYEQEETLREALRAMWDECW